MLGTLPCFLITNFQRRKFWTRKFWQFCCNTPNSPKFSPSKVLYHTVLHNVCKKLKKTGLNKLRSCLLALFLATSILSSFTAPSIGSLVQLKIFEILYHVSYNSPNQRAPKMAPCTFCWEMECFYAVALIFVTDL